MWFIIWKERLFLLIDYFHHPLFFIFYCFNMHCKIIRHKIHKIHIMITTVVYVKIILTSLSWIIPIMRQAGNVTWWAQRRENWDLFCSTRACLRVWAVANSGRLGRNGHWALWMDKSHTSFSSPKCREANFFQFTWIYANCVECSVDLLLMLWVPGRQC